MSTKAGFRYRRAVSTSGVNEMAAADFHRRLRTVIAGKLTDEADAD